MSYLHIDRTTNPKSLLDVTDSLFLSICTHIPANENLFPQIFLLNLNVLLQNTTSVEQLLPSPQYFCSKLQSVTSHPHQHLSRKAKLMG